MEELKEVLHKIDKQLKGFQAASVQYVLDQFYKKNRNKVLIADEVGLGKTIIAKGVIAKSIEHRKDPKKPFHVVYICSNQVLAQQNLYKLNPIGKVEKAFDRLVFLANQERPSNNPYLKLSSLTPSTSFQLTNGVGIKEERAMIYLFLLEDSELKLCRGRLKKLMQTTAIGDESWETLVSYKKKHKKILYRPEIASKFIEHLKIVPFAKEDFSRSIQYLGEEPINFLDGLRKLLEKLKQDRKKDPKDFSYEVVRALRVELTHICLDYLDADLFILDEFQRFKSLLDGDDNSEASEIAKAVLRKDEARVLLLSATPFKPFTTQLEQLSGEDHHDEFRKLVEFLGGSKGKKLWRSFKEDQEAFFTILRTPKIALENPELAKSKKNNLEKQFKKFLSRNERLGVAKDYNNMTIDSSKDKMDILESDVASFIAMDHLLQEVEKVNGQSQHRFGSSMEFNKSAPFPLSFLQGYKIKDLLDKVRSEHSIRSILSTNPQAWLKYSDINQYNDLGNNSFPNGKFRLLSNEIFRNKGELLLWVPPTLPFYKSFGVFEKTTEFSKVLVFSSWAMAPRAISTMLSYELERRTVGNKNVLDNQESNETREYYSTPRKPAPLLVYKTTEKKKKTNYMMSNFILTYPSITLAETSLLNDVVNAGSSYTQLKALQQQRIKELFEEFKIQEKYSSFNEREDKSWYWISGPLLDEIRQLNNSALDGYSGSNNEWSEGLNKHIEHLKSELKAVLNGDKKLGRFPQDLFDILANISLSSPAVTALIAFKDHYNSEEYNCEEAFEVSNSFLSMFNKPESICTVRLSIKKYRDYWRKTLFYCAQGNLYAMMDEYIYMLKQSSSIDTPSAASEVFQNVLMVRTSSIGVDLLTESGEYDNFKMRTHFAVSYGDQKMTSEAGNNRMINVRDVFNSPFRPFVLASTSIGQEGLDFHFYCRKIFHWNLPNNAIDLEQREGRINRFKGLVIRKKIIQVLEKKGMLESLKKDPTIWDSIFSLAEILYKDDKTDIKPFWYLDEGESNIERFVPVHRYSKDAHRYEQLKITLALYRLTFGQPRQEELIEAMKTSGLDQEDIKQIRDSLLINLSPIKR